MAPFGGIADMACPEVVITLIEYDAPKHRRYRVRDVVMCSLQALGERITLNTSFLLGGVTINGLRFNAAIVACGAALIASAGNLHASELRPLAGGAMSGVWAEIKPQFEHASGHKLEIFFGNDAEPHKGGHVGQAVRCRSCACRGHAGCVSQSQVRGRSDD